MATTLESLEPHAFLELDSDAPESRHSLVTAAFVAYVQDSRARIIEDTISVVVRKAPAFAHRDSLEFSSVQTHLRITRTHISWAIERIYVQLMNRLTAFESHIDIHERLSFVMNDYLVSQVADASNNGEIIVEFLFRAFERMRAGIDASTFALPFNYELDSSLLVPNFKNWSVMMARRAIFQNMRLLPLAMIQSEVDDFFRNRAKAPVTITRNDVRSAIKKLEATRDFSRFDYSGNATVVAVCDSLLKLSNAKSETMRVQYHIERTSRFEFLKGTACAEDSDSYLEGLALDLTVASRTSEKKFERLVKKLEKKLAVHSNSALANNRFYFAALGTMPEDVLRLALALAKNDPEDEVSKFTSYAEILSFDAIELVFKPLRSYETAEATTDAYSHASRLERIRSLDATKVIAGLVELNYFVLTPSAEQIEYVSNILAMTADAFASYTANISDSEAVDSDSIAKLISKVRTQNVATAMFYGRQAAVLFNGVSNSHADSLALRKDGSLIAELERLDANIVHLALGLTGF